MCSIQLKNFVVDGVEGTLSYTVEECIAKCRNGVVLKARVMKWPRPGGPEFLAIKQLDGSLDDNLFEKEFEKHSKQIGYLEKLRHENVLRYYTVFKMTRASAMETSKICIVMEYCSADFKKVWRSLGFLGTQHLLAQVVLGLSYLHSNGIVHGDLKPANIVADEGEYNTFIVKICDLDESIIVGKGNIDEIDIEFGVGTPMYYSPEMGSRIASRESNQKVGFKTDIWSLGCVLLDMTTLFEKESRIILDGEQIGTSLGKEVSVMASSGVPPCEFDLYLHHILSGGVPAVRWLRSDVQKFTSSCLKHYAAERCSLDSIFSPDSSFHNTFCTVSMRYPDEVFLEQRSKLTPGQYLRDVRAIIRSNLFSRERYCVALYPDTDFRTLPDSIRSVQFIGFGNWTSDILSHGIFGSVEKLEFSDCGDLTFRSGSPRYPQLRSINVITGCTFELDDNVLKELMNISTFVGNRKGLENIIANSPPCRPCHQLSPEFVSAFPMPRFNWSDVMGKLGSYSPFFREGIRDCTASFRSMKCLSLTASSSDYNGLMVISLVANPRHDLVLWEKVGIFLKELSQIIDGHPCGLRIDCSFPLVYGNDEFAPDIECLAVRVSSALSAIKAQIVKLTIGKDYCKNRYYIKQLLHCLDLPQLLELEVNFNFQRRGWELSYEDFTGFLNLRKLLIPVDHFDADRPVFGGSRNYAFTRVDDTPMVDNIRQSRLSDHGYEEGELWELKGNGYLYRSKPFARLGGRRKGLGFE